MKKEKFETASGRDVIVYHTGLSLQYSGRRYKYDRRIISIEASIYFVFTAIKSAPKHHSTMLLILIWLNRMIDFGGSLHFFFFN